ncbi:MAG: thymidine phosphorylase [Clostridia bacterium]|nr:thymidine phosphorylase [Clostridia bacterium]
MRIYDIIEKKKRGLELSREEIEFFVGGFTGGAIPDYQASALLMAIYFQGMSAEECAHLTDAMSRSGEVIDLELFGRHSADKHSSGGVGDKTTLIVAPLAASMGCTVAKMSGRGLGHTGGTVDKLESFPGYRTALSREEFVNQVREIGVAVVGQTENITPADKKLYALRDVTATVDSIPLIAASIMSKKLAAGSRSVTLDVKCGSGAFMKRETDACELAELMVDIGCACGRRTAALVTDMSFPLGRCVGNTLEVKEALEVLSGRGDERLTELCVELSADMAEGALGLTHEEALTKAREHLANRLALKKFKEWMIAQGADAELVEHPDRLPCARYITEVRATESGYVSECDTELIGKAAQLLGAGRVRVGDEIDLTAGIELAVNRGDFVMAGSVIAYLHSSNEKSLEDAREAVKSAYKFDFIAPKAVPIVLHRITK